MTTRPLFTSEFKAKVALEALRDDKTIQVTAWKQRAVGRMKVVLSKGAERRVVRTTTGRPGTCTRRSGS